MSELHREFPQSAEAERGVLSALFQAPLEVHAMCAEEGLDERDFYLPAHGIIFAAMAGTIDSGRPLEFIGLLQFLKDKDWLERVGGGAYLNELSVLLPSPAYAMQHIRIVREKAKRRALIAALTKGMEAAYRGEEDTEELVANVHAAVGSLIHTRSKRPNHRDVLQAIIDEVREGRDDTNLVTIPIQAMHGRLRVYRGDLLMVTAPTSCGKTALASQMGLALAGQGLRVAFYPLEMAQSETLKRAISQQGGHNPDFVRKLVKDNQGREASDYVLRTVKEFMDTARDIGKMDLHIRDDLNRWEHIRADIRTEHARRPFTFILIDYLQLIQTSGRHERRQLAIAEITQGAKLLAGELGCVICMPSQVNKDGGTREAQDAENDASSLIKIHPLEGKDEPEPGRVTVWKQRNGKRHIDLPLRFNASLTRFDYAEP